LKKRKNQKERMKIENLNRRIENKRVKKQLKYMRFFSPVFILLLTCFCGAGKIIHPLNEREVKSFLEELNGQGIIITQIIYEEVKEDKFRGYNSKDGSFWLEGFISDWFFLYRTDINNDEENEYILAGAGGSGCFFRIDAIYQKQGGKLVDIFDEIKIPMWKLIREKYREVYDTLGGGIIIIEEKNDKTLFTLEEHARDYDSEGFMHKPTKRWQFLWENGDIQLVK
jgi:hypothetical protein